MRSSSSAEQAHALAHSPPLVSCRSSSASPPTARLHSAASVPSSRVVYLARSCWCAECSVRAACRPVVAATRGCASGLARLRPAGRQAARRSQRGHPDCTPLHSTALRCAALAHAHCDAIRHSTALATRRPLHHATVDSEQRRGLSRASRRNCPANESRMQASSLDAARSEADTKTAVTTHRDAL